MSLVISVFCGPYRSTGEGPRDPGVEGEGVGSLVEVTLEQLLLQRREHEGRALLDPWRIVVGDADLGVLVPTCLGHLFLERSDGAILFLDTWVGAVSNVAPSYEQFKESIETDPQFQSDYLFVDLVADLIDAGLARAEGQCFSPFVSPGIGGSLKPSNFQPMDLLSHQMTLAAEHRAVHGSEGDQ